MAPADLDHLLEDYRNRLVTPAVAYYLDSSHVKAPAMRMAVALSAYRWWLDGRYQVASRIAKQRGLRYLSSVLDLFWGQASERLCD